MVNRFDLLEISWVKHLLRSRTFQPAILLITLSFFVIAIMTGLWGTPAGSHNFSIVYIWIVWWAALMIVLVPFFGRLWCMVCPIPAPGEWLQRRAIIQKATNKLRSLNWRWPRKLKNIWLQNAAFLGMALFSTIILTRPGVTAWVLLGMVLVAVVLSVIYNNRVFCRYVCPVGGFIGLYSLSAGLELRVKDPEVCLAHKTKDCVVGNECGYGCPWLVYPGKLERNAYCGLCTECIKTCTQDNIALNLRPLGQDLFVAKERKLDEAYKSLIMLTCAAVYSAVLLGPWGWIKQWANMDTASHWAIYAVGFLFANLVLVPGLFATALKFSQKISGVQGTLKKLFTEYAYSLVPLGLAGWMAFSIGFVFVNGSYALATLSDPFGWGWNLFGTANAAWQPVMTGGMSIIQAAILNIGLALSTLTAYRIGRQQFLSPLQAIRGAVPVAAFQLLMTLGFTHVYLG